MSAHLPTQASSVFSRRRAELCKALGDTVAVIFAGGPRSRNYPANVYPFRAESHFLYLVGASIPDAILVLRRGRAELFAPPNTPDDALWHGPSPEPDTIAAATGVDRVRPLAQFPHALVDIDGPVATLPATDPLTRAQQTRWMNRTWPLGGTVELVAQDAALADGIIELRLRHDDAAIEMIRTALKGTGDAHAAGMAATKPGASEADIRAAMEHALMAHGMDPAYGSIVTVHGEILHNNDYVNRLEPRDLVLADVGGEWHGWSSDITRTWPVAGKFSATQRTFYELVLQAQKDAIEMIAPGVRYRDVHLRACSTLARGLVDEKILSGDPQGLVERGAHALLFPHGIGHLLGLDVHDMEDLGDRAGYGPGRARSSAFGLGYLRLDRDLEPGMIVTIEPGLYIVPAILNSKDIAGPFIADKTFDPDRLEAFSDVRGIRIEDDVLCTTTGHEVLSSSIPKEVAAIERSVGSS